MNVFDFDNTLYDGESTIDYFFFAIRKNKKLIKHIPLVIKDLILYRRCKIGKEKIITDCEKVLKEMISSKEPIQDQVKEFWETHRKHLKPKMLKLVHEEDLIISASPEFIFEPIFDELHTKNLFTSRVNLNSGKIHFLCFGHDKVEKYHEEHSEMFDTFYTDSMNDRPLMAYAKNVYLVKGIELEKIK